MLALELLRLTWEEFWLITPFSACRYHISIGSGDIRDLSLKMYSDCHACLWARHVKKFRKANITANRLNFSRHFPFVDISISSGEV